MYVYIKLYVPKKGCTPKISKCLTFATEARLKTITTKEEEVYEPQKSIVHDGDGNGPRGSRESTSRLYRRTGENTENSVRGISPTSSEEFHISSK